MSRRPTPPDPAARAPRDRRVKPVAPKLDGDRSLPEIFEDVPWPSQPATPARRSGPPPRTDRELPGVPRSRRSTAGRVIGAGLICFGLWTVFDANQLYHNALTAPLGARRTASIEFLRPIAAVMNALRISGPVNAADSALNRNGVATSPTLPPLPPPPEYAEGRPPNNANAWGYAPRPHSPSGKDSGKDTGARTSVGPPPLPQPTRAHPLEMLDIGDSIGDDLGMGLNDVFSGDPYVTVSNEAQINTGLANPGYYNWPVELELDLRKYHPGAVVMMMGANDDQALAVPNHGSVATGTPLWDSVYRHRITLMMDEATDAGARVVWVGLPPVQDSAVTPAFAVHINQIAQSVAAATAGVTYVSSWSLLAGPGGTFVQYKKIDGSILQIRYGDGVHLAPSGWDLLASYLLEPMHKAWHINLHATPVIPVPNYP